jgi:hypothetical protein
MTFATRAGLIAMLGFAAASCGGEPVRIAMGRPMFAPGSPEAYWIWHDVGGWHLRTTTSMITHQFEGLIRPYNGTITEMRPTRDEWNDRIRIGPDGIAFSFQTGGGMDGFDWRVSSGCNEFHLRIDGVPAPGRVFLGGPGNHPMQMPFMRCR